MSTFSPVKEALFTFRSLEVSTLTSAGTFSPNLTLTISPGTNKVASIVYSFPSLTTLTVAGESAFSAAMT
jgi:hypothetical protein